MDDDSAKPANCFARGFVHLTADNRKWHRQRKYRVPRLHRRLPTPASAYSELHVFVRHVMDGLMIIYLVE
jgi:hypothetical protein